MKTFDFKTALIVMLAILVIFLWWRSGNNYNKFQEQEALIKVANDSLQTMIDENGIQRARIAAFEAREIETFLQFQNADSLIIALQSKVKEFKDELKSAGTATVFTTVTKVDTHFVGGIQTLPGDTVRRDSFIYIYPKYVREFNLDNWVKGEITMGMDTLGLKANSRNEYSVVVGREKQGLFKKSKLFVEVTNSNPYSETTAVRAFKVSEDTKRVNFGIGAYGGFGATRIRDGTIHAGPQLGVGLLLKLNF